MNPLASILLSIHSLGRNKVRTFLTMLGELGVIPIARHAACK